MIIHHRMLAKWVLKVMVVTAIPSWQVVSIVTIMPNDAERDCIKSNSNLDSAYERTLRVRQASLFLLSFRQSCRYS